MTATATTLTATDVAAIIRGRPAIALDMMPPLWQSLADTRGTTLLSDEARTDYVEAARIFRFHHTPLGIEALNAIAHDFASERYPDFAALENAATTDVAKKTIAAVKDIFAELGHDVPAALYDVMLATGLRDDHSPLLAMFRNKTNLLRDRLWDAALHAALLVTPISLFIHSVFSRHGLRFMHVMDCGCDVSAAHEPAFTITLDAGLKRAHLQNMMAAAFEQYGVNAATSRAGRGF